MDSNAPITKPAASFGSRHVQYLLMFTVTVIGYGMRTILNVAVISMIGKDDKTKDKNYPTYPEWESKKNLMLSSFFWGYVCFQVFAGQLAKKYGAKLFLTCAMSVGSVATLLIPVLGDKCGYIGVIVCRVIQGATQGFLFPSIHTLLSLWAPLSERAKWGGIVYTGQPVGNVISMPVTGAIAASSVGWPAVFYLYGTLGLLWCVVYFFFGSASPTTDKRMTQEERRWIESEIDETEDKDKVPTPFKAIFTSVPFLALLVTHCGQSWGFWTLLTEIPSYMQKVLEFDIASNSLLSALPYFVMFILNMIMSPLADWIIGKKYVKLATSRKIFNSIGHFGPAIALIVLCLVGSSDKTVIITLLVLAVGTNAGSYCGFNVNHIDLAPVHAGTLMGITNSIASILGILAPLAVDLISNISGYKEEDVNLWHIVFYVAAGIYLVAGSTFIIFGSGEVQPWNSSVPIRKASEPKSVDEEDQKRGSLRY